MLQVVPAYVAHENLDSVNLLIMWDSQSETLAQGTLSHVACQELARQRSRTTASNIVQHLKPALEVLLMVMLKPAHMSLADMHAFADAMVQFHNYFTRFDWESTWASSVVGHSVPSSCHPSCIYAEWHLSSCAAAAAAAAAVDQQSCAVADERVTFTLFIAKSYFVCYSTLCQQRYKPGVCLHALIWRSGEINFAFC